MQELDELQRTQLREKFQLACATKKGMAFQDWFVLIAKAHYGSDFEQVRPTGQTGDYKSDGYISKTQTVFQCYAPDDYKEKKVIDKVTQDFNGALTKWENQIKEWVLVVNKGQSPKVTQLLNDLRYKHPGIAIKVFDENEIWNLVCDLPLNRLEPIFGILLSRKALDEVGFEDIKPVLQFIERNPDGCQDESVIKPVSESKLEKNGLDALAKVYLTMGRLKEYLVQEYFDSHNEPEFGNTIAQKYKSKYEELKYNNIPTGEMFIKLHRFTGGGASNTRREAAVLAVMSYFFERCDIFEDP
jgi:hypothetical protein